MGRGPALPQGCRNREHRRQCGPWGVSGGTWDPSEGLAWAVSWQVGCRTAGASPPAADRAGIKVVPLSPEKRGETSENTGAVENSLSPRGSVRCRGAKCQRPLCTCSGPSALEEAGLSRAARHEAHVASHVALGRLRPTRAETPCHIPPSTPRSPAGTLGSLSEVHGLIPWMGCLFCPGKGLMASHQPQGGLVQGLWGV